MFTLQHNENDPKNVHDVNNATNAQLGQLIPDDEFGAFIKASCTGMENVAALVHSWGKLSDSGASDVRSTSPAQCVKVNGGETIDTEAQAVEPVQCGRERQESKHAPQEPCTRGLRHRAKSLLGRPAQLLRRRIGRKRAASSRSDDGGESGAPESKRAKPVSSAKPRRFLRAGKRLLAKRDRKLRDTPS